MKQIQGAIQVLKLVAKYGAYFIVIFDIVNYAVEKFEEVASKKDKEELNGN
jgi:hypothetical protein